MSEEAVSASIDQRLAAERLRLFGSVIDAAGDGIAVLTPSSEPTGPRFAFVNDSFCRIYGVRREEVLGRDLTALRIVERHQAIFDDMLEHVFDIEAFDAEATARRIDGGEFELDLQLVPVVEGGVATHWAAFLRDVTDSRNQLLKLRRQAMYDPLTDLPNRALLFDQLEKAIDASRRERGSVALLLMDLDRFKDVNDTFGHHFGDILLQQIAVRLRALLRAGDSVARLGGDEFGIVLRSASDSNDVAMFARRILDSLQQPFDIEGHVMEVGASIGITL